MSEINGWTITTLDEYIEMLQILRAEAGRGDIPVVIYDDGIYYRVGEPCTTKNQEIVLSEPWEIHNIEKTVLPECVTL